MTRSMRLVRRESQTPVRQRREEMQEKERREEAKGVGRWRGVEMGQRRRERERRVEKAPRAVEERSTLGEQLASRREMRLQNGVALSYGEGRAQGSQLVERLID